MITSELFKNLKIIRFNKIAKFYIKKNKIFSNSYKQFTTNKEKKIKFIHGPTGSGKTLEIIKQAIKHLNDPNSKGVIIIAMSSREMAQFVYNDIKNETDSDGKILLYISGYKSAINGLIINSTFNETEIPKVIITTHGYIKTRGYTPILYNFHLDLL
jgi:Rad3-related DNA helicase